LINSYNQQGVCWISTAIVPISSPANNSNACLNYLQ
jgi:hypothetical protein